jgi:hypothetical protein
MKKLAILAFLICLTGCATFKDKFCDYKVIAPEKPMELDPRVWEGCKELVTPTLPLSWEGILYNTKVNKLIYEDCFNKQKSSIVIIRKLSNN